MGRGEAEDGRGGHRGSGCRRALPPLRSLVVADQLVVPGAEEDVTWEVCDGGAAPTGVGSGARRCPRAGRGRCLGRSPTPTSRFAEIMEALEAELDLRRRDLLRRLRPDWTGVGERLSQAVAGAGEICGGEGIVYQCGRLRCIPLSHPDIEIYGDLRRRARPCCICRARFVEVAEA